MRLIFLDIQLTCVCHKVATNRPHVSRVGHHRYRALSVNDRFFPTPSPTYQRHDRLLALWQEILLERFPRVKRAYVKSGKEKGDVHDDDMSSGEIPKHHTLRIRTRRQTLVLRQRLWEH